MISLSKFKNLYDSGLMRIIQGVGYPIQDKSHFKSTDLWLTGGDGTPANNVLESGWVGRFLENYYADFITANFPLGIQLGSSDNSLGFHGEVEQDNPPKNVFYESYTLAYSNNMAGTLTAPFKGKHGWYFRNETKEDIVVTIILNGQYELFK